MDYFAFFRQIHALEAEAWHYLASKLKPKSFAKHEFLLREGQIQNELYLVEKGIQMSYFDNADKMQVMAFTYPPSLCAVPESFLLQKPSVYYLQALSETEVQALAYPALQECFDNFRSIETLFRKMTEQVLAGLIQRHLDLQILTIEERFVQLAQRSPHLLQLVPHKYIANYLGINPTNFSKLYNQVKV